jgi:peptide chain release factor 1
VGYKAHNLDQVLEGDLQAVVDALIEADLADRLAAVESQTP